MQTISIERADGHLAEIIAKLSPGQEMLLTCNNVPVARLRRESAEASRPVPGRGKGMLTVISDDAEHLKDFAEYMP